MPAAASVKRSCSSPHVVETDRRNRSEAAIRLAPRFGNPLDLQQQTTCLRDGGARVFRELLI
jgi:hypothetical protein